MTAVTSYITDGTHDTHFGINGGIHLWASNLHGAGTLACIGSDDVSNWYDGKYSMLFYNVYVPKGVTITSAYITFRAYTYQGTPSLILGVEDSVSPTPPTSWDDFESRTLSSYVSYVPSTWESGSYYNSPSLSSMIQTIINKTGWNSGQSMQFFWSDDGSSTFGTWRRCYSYEDGSSYAPVLHISYDITKSLSDGVKVSESISLTPNKLLTDGINISDSITETIASFDRVFSDVVNISSEIGLSALDMKISFGDGINFSDLSGVLSTLFLSDGINMSDTSGNNAFRWVRKIFNSIDWSVISRMSSSWTKKSSPSDNWVEKEL